MNIIKIVFFKSYNTESQLLSAMIEKKIQEVFCEFGYDYIYVVYNSWGLIPSKDNPETSAYFLLKAAFNNDIVIIDGSLDKTSLSFDVDFGKNYECITPAVMSLDNVIVLSRTQIPLNFLPTRSNVCPLGKDEDPVNLDNKRLHGFSKKYTNEQIVCWLKSELISMYNNKTIGDNGVEYNRLFRNPQYKLDITVSLDDLIKIQEHVFNENSVALKRERHSLQSSKRCFISYRGTYCKKGYRSSSGREYTVEDVKNVILGKYPNAEVIYFKEGALSNEFMPEVRRWGFVSYIDRVIRECDEFWIFDTKYKNQESENTLGYWDSWWCLGEILTLMRMKANLQLKPDFRIMVFDPDEENGQITYPIDMTKWHKITQEENQELARYYANSDFFEAGYESAKNMRALRKWPTFIQKIRFYLLKKFVFPVVLSDESDEYKFEIFQKSIYSHVYDKSFYSGRIFTSPTESSKGVDITILYDKDFVWKFLNINGWYSNPKNPSGHIVEKYPGADFITEEQFTDQKRKEIGVIKDESDEFYIWWVPRKGRRTGPNGCIIEIVELYKKQ
ncbi:MAG: hypothetical protein J1E57_09590 [Prevotella sp.]|nr:hypothetical protein [Prevotella sp.]